MSRYETEQEQLEAIKAWWKKYGNHILTVALIFAVAFAGYRYWQMQVYNKAAAASSVFEMLEASAEQGNFAEVSREARKLMLEQPKSPYAASAALMLAQHHWEKAEKDEAIEALNWVVENSDIAEMKFTAGLRLARLYTEQKEFVKAKQQLDSLPNALGEQKAAIDFTAGILSLAQEDFTAAKAAFQSVFDNFAANQDLRNLARLQLDDLAN